MRTGYFFTSKQAKVSVSKLCWAAVVLAVSAAWWLGGASAAAQTTDSHTAQTLEKLRGLGRGVGIRAVAVSPDGKQLAWSEGGRIKVAPLGDLQKAEPVMVTKDDGQCEESDYTWSPDSKALVFFSDCGSTDGQRDLYSWTGGTDPARKLTALKGYTDMPEFAPDGKSIAFLYVEGATRPAGALAAMKPWAGVIGEDGVEIQRIALVKPDAADQTPQMISPANLHVFEFDWRPDSKGLAYVAANPPGENNWWVAKLYTSTIGGEPKAILAPAEVAGPLHGLQIAVPRWRPDGKAIAFIGGLMSDQGSTGGDVWQVAAEGGEPHNLTADRRATPGWLEWDGNAHLYVSELAGGNSRLVRMRVEGNAASDEATVYSVPASVGDGRMHMSLSDTADRKLFVFQASAFDHAPEIYAARPGAAAADSLGGLAQLSHLNDGLTPAWGKVTSLEWTNEGFHVQGWLMQPKDYDPAKKYPLIVIVHGGPAAAVTARWGAGGSLSPAVFSALGYFVLQPNPRGSFGQGERFTEANRKDFGYGDLRDILAGVDAAEAKFSIDDKRVGLTGWSYGGFMSMFAVTQTGRFRAAVAGAGIADWKSYYGENSIGAWMIPYFGASVYDDPAVYAKVSAIEYIRKVKTPTLVVVGDRDGECPAPQSFEFWHALKAQGVPTQLVVYPNEGHGFVNPEHRRDVLLRAVDWFEKYMPAGE